MIATAMPTTTTTAGASGKSGHARRGARPPFIVIVPVAMPAPKLDGWGARDESTCGSYIVHIECLRGSAMKLSPNTLRSRARDLGNVRSRSGMDPAAKRWTLNGRDMAKNFKKPVTLIVYGWRENAPGTLAWVFPSKRAAMRAVRAFSNAIDWLIVKGRRASDALDLFDVEALRRSGLVLSSSAA